MHKDVLIKVSGIQGAMSDHEMTEMITTGQFYEKNGKSYIVYEDLSLTQDQATATTIKFDENQVSILRYGGANTQMIFEKDKGHYAPYETPFGIFDIMLHTSNIAIQKSEGHLALKVDYSIDINKSGSMSSQFVVEISDNHPL